MEMFTEAQEMQIAIIFRRELQRQSEVDLRAKLKTTLSIPEAAEILDASENFIWNLLKAGKLERVKIVGRTYVTIKSLKEIQKPQ